MTLTDRQRAILDFLVAWQDRHGYPPTRAEIATAFGFSQARSAEDHLRALAAKGAISLDVGRSRGIRILTGGAGGNEAVAAANDDLVCLPLVGRVAAGAPILSDAHVADRYTVDRRLFRPRAHFLLRVEGDSMRDAGILDGDLVAVHRTPVADPGQIVVARLDDEITIKRLQRNRAGRWRLLPANSDYSAIEIDPERHDFAIEGLHVGVIRR